jgi:hypothetical protein
MKGISKYHMHKDTRYQGALESRNKSSLKFFIQKDKSFRGESLNKICLKFFEKMRLNVAFPILNSKYILKMDIILSILSLPPAFIFFARKPLVNIKHGI